LTVAVGFNPRFGMANAARRGATFALFPFAPPQWCRRPREVEGRGQTLRIDTFVTPKESVCAPDISPSIHRPGALVNNSPSQSQICGEPFRMRSTSAHRPPHVQSDDTETQRDVTFCSDFFIFFLPFRSRVPTTPIMKPHSRFFLLPRGHPEPRPNRGNPSHKVRAEALSRKCAQMRETQTRASDSSRVPRKSTPPSVSSDQVSEFKPSFCETATVRRGQSEPRLLPRSTPIFELRIPIRLQRKSPRISEKHHQISAWRRHSPPLLRSPIIPSPISDHPSPDRSKSD